MLWVGVPRRKLYDQTFYSDSAVYDGVSLYDARLNKNLKKKFTDKRT